MGASCAVWANALAAIKKATRNAKDSARIVSLATVSRPTHKRSESHTANQGGAVSCSPSLGPDQTHQRCILRLFDCPLAGVRDLHADDLDRTSAHLHRIALHAGKPIADKVCYHLGWEAVPNQHFVSPPPPPPPSHPSHSPPLPPPR